MRLQGRDPGSFCLCRTIVLDAWQARHWGVEWPANSTDIAMGVWQVCYPALSPPPVESKLHRQAGRVSKVQLQARWQHVISTVPNPLGMSDVHTLWKGKQA